MRQGVRTQPGLPAADSSGGFCHTGTFRPGMDAGGNQRRTVRFPHSGRDLHRNTTRNAPRLPTGRYSAGTPTILLRRQSDHAAGVIGRRIPAVENHPSRHAATTGQNPYLRPQHAGFRLHLLQPHLYQRTGDEAAGHRADRRARDAPCEAAPQLGHSAVVRTADSILVESVRVAVGTFAQRGARVPGRRCGTEQRFRFGTIHRADPRRTYRHSSGVCQRVLLFTHQKTPYHDRSKQTKTPVEIQNFAGITANRAPDGLLFLYRTPGTAIRTYGDRRHRTTVLSEQRGKPPEVIHRATNVLFLRNRDEWRKCDRTYLPRAAAFDSR